MVLVLNRSVSVPLPIWDQVRDALADAIRAALPLQVAQAAGERIAGLGLHLDAYYGSAGLYLLPESAAQELGRDQVINIGGWPISTDWEGTQNHAEAFQECWGYWDDWFRDRTDDHSDDELETIAVSILRAACEAMQQVEAEGGLDGFDRTPSFRIIIVEHHEPDEWGVERYELFSRTGSVCVFGSEQLG